ncbi:unnamed protein product [Eruca vesicaria subsp. sativa]|uniref:X8 domain-containing protein n=1 Tax=Eruca vesicaria subsp. sativa TaxID=29727 RepID=A0ABC8K750_ERUVS|nr:unnamed protein product [Eruca vesicaria subsp. sativa]
MNITEIMCLRSALVFLILSIVVIDHLPLASAGQWCVVSPSATDAQMQANIDWLCGHGHVDCIPIKPGVQVVKAHSCEFRHLGSKSNHWRIYMRTLQRPKLKIVLT